jgi:hypothetical protein
VFELMGCRLMQILEFRKRNYGIFQFCNCNLFCLLRIGEEKVERISVELWHGKLDFEILKSFLVNLKECFYERHHFLVKCTM